MTTQDTEDRAVDDVAAHFELDRGLACEVVEAITTCIVCRQSVVTAVADVAGITGLPGEVEPIDLVVYAAGRMGYQADI